MATALDRGDQEGRSAGGRAIYLMKPAICETWNAESWNVWVPLASEWNDLPTGVQRRLFDRAASGKSHDATRLKTRIARFLHDHKDASSKRKFLRATIASRRYFGDPAFESH